MNDKERLKIILDNSTYDHNFEEFTVPLKDMDWLIQQAERVDELEEKIKLERRMNKDLHKLVKFLQENPRLAQDKFGEPVSLVAISAMELLQEENKQAMTRVHALATIVTDQEQKYKDLIEEIEKTHKTTMICANCNGSGKGPGVMARLRLINSAPDRRLVTCDMCNGYGRIKRANVDEEVEF